MRTARRQVVSPLTRIGIVVRGSRKESAQRIERRDSGLTLNNAGDSLPIVLMAAAGRGAYIFHHVREH